MFVIFGIALCLIGIYLGLKGMGWLGKPTAVDLRPVEAQKVDRFIQFGLAAVCLGLGIYLLLPAKDLATQKFSNSNAQIPQKPNYENLANWNDESRKALMQQCMENGKRTSEKYPEIVKQYCECATEKITLAFTPQSYQEMLSKPVEEQRQAISPVVESCVLIMNKLMQLTDEAQPQRSK